MSGVVSSRSSAASGTGAGSQTWGSDFLPGFHQGTHIVPGPEPIANLRRRVPSDALQEMELGMVAEANRRHLQGRAAERPAQREQERLRVIVARADAGTEHQPHRPLRQRLQFHRGCQVGRRRLQRARGGQE